VSCKAAPAQWQGSVGGGGSPLQWSHQLPRRRSNLNAKPSKPHLLKLHRGGGDLGKLLQCTPAWVGQGHGETPTWETGTRTASHTMHPTARWLAHLPPRAWPWGTCRRGAAESIMRGSVKQRTGSHRRGPQRAAPIHRMQHEA
jgi:hypothetical protein